MKPFLSRIALFSVVAVLLGVLALPQTSIQSASRFHRLLQLGRGYIDSAQWHPSGKMLVVNTALGAWFYDDTLQDIAHLEEIRLTRFNSRGNLIAAGQGDRVVLLDSSSRKVVKVFEEHAHELVDLVWSPDGNKLGAVWKDNLSVVWDTKTYQKLLGFQQSNAIFWSPDSEKLATFSSDQKMGVIWQVATGRIQTTLDFAAKSKYNVRGGGLIWTPDSRRLLRTAQFEESVIFQVWDVQTAMLLFEEENNGVDAAFSPDGKNLALSLQFRGGRMVDPITFETRFTLDEGSSWLFLRWSPRGDKLAGLGSGFPISYDGYIRLWDSATGKVMYTLKSHSPVQTLEWSPDGSALLSVNEDNVIRIWNVSTGQIAHERSDHAQISGAVEWSSDSAKIAIADTIGNVRLWDNKTGRELARFGDHHDIVLVTWQPRGKLLAVAGYNISGYGLGIGEDANICVWDTATGQLAAMIPFPEHVSISSLSWDMTGDQLVGMNWNATSKIWDVATKLSKTFIPYSLGGAYSATFSPDGKKLLILAYGGSIGLVPIVWDIAAGKNLEDGVAVPWMLLPGRSYGWSASGDTLFIAEWPITDDYCKVRGCTGDNQDPNKYKAGIRPLFTTDAALKNKSFVVLAGHTGSITSVIWSPDSKRIATTSEDHTLRLWDAATGKTQLVIKDVDSALWSPDERMLAVWNTGQSVRILDSSTGQLIDTLGASTGFLLWGPDSRKLARWFSGVLTIWGR